MGGGASTVRASTAANGRLGEQKHASSIFLLRVFALYLFREGGCWGCCVQYWGFRELREGEMDVVKSAET